MKVRLGDICEVFTDGDWIESKDQSVSGIRLIQTGNIGNGEFLNKTPKKRYISKMTFNNLKCTEVFAGDILISRLPDPIGRCCIVPELPERAITAVDCTICRVKESIADLNYLCCFLQSPKYFSQLKVKITGTTRKRISRKNLGEIQVSLPSLEEQKKIASNIYQITHLMNIRKKEYALLDQLVKSRFMEMFGEQYEEITIGSSFITTSGGTPAKSNKEYYENGSIPWLTSGEVNSGVITKPSNFITELGLKHSSAKLIPANSVVIAMYGATAGQVGLVKYETSTNQAVCSIMPQDRFISEYLYYAVQQKKQWMKEQCTGGAQPNISQTIIKKMRIRNAPLPLQQQFADFVEKVDKSKLAVKQSLEKLETLKKSLMQQYFG